MEEKVFFKTSDGLKLCGILSTPKRKTQKCIVLCHGITVDKEEDGIFTQLSRSLSQAGFVVFRFDFRGHGESEGEQIEMTITGEVKDLEAAVKFLQERGYREFGILGASFAGGSVSSFTSSHPETVRALVLWNAVINYAENINPTLPWTIKYWGKPAFDRAKKFGFTEVGSRGFKAGKNLMEEIKTLKPWKELRKTDVPILFVHGDQDNCVPVADSVKYAAIMKNARLKIIKGADHGFHDDSKHAEEADQATIDFLLKNLQ